MIENCIQRCISCHTFVLIILLTSGKAHSSSQLENAQVCTTMDCRNSAKYIMENLDPTVEPCEDFYQFACGNWKERHPVPEYLQSYDVFAMVTDDVDMKLKKDIEKPINPNDPHLIQYGKKIYATCMSEDLQDRLGLSEFLKWFNRFGGWPMANYKWDSSLFNWEEAHIDISRESINQAPFLKVDVIPDYIEDSSQPIISISLAELPLANSAYLNPEDYSVTVTSYVDLMKSMVRILSSETHELNDMDKDSVFNLEATIAQIKNDTKFPLALNESVYRMTISELNILTNGKFNWLRYFQGLFKDIKEIQDDQPVLLGEEPINFIRLFDYLANLNDRSMSNYLMWRYALNYGIYINSQIRHAFFNFLQFENTDRSDFPRWMYCMSMMQQHYYPVMSYLYIKDYFGTGIKENAQEMFEIERISLKNLFKDTYWMDNYTLTITNKKIDEMIILIGYPEWLKDPTAVENYYKEMPNSTEYLIDNVRNIFIHTISLTLQGINSPINRKRWYSHPEHVMSTYYRMYNSLHIPAASLQLPFFSTNGLKAMNFGAIGMHFGHEMMQEFDLKDYQLDKYGNMTHWTQYVEQEYIPSAVCLLRQYSKYCFPDVQQRKQLLDPLCVNGATLNENIADNAGIKVAFNAYQSWVKDHGEESRLQGLTQFSPQQLFFLSFAQSFCSVQTDDGLLDTLNKDEHAPYKYRILGTLTNSDDFANVFQCPIGSQMNPLSLKCTFF